MVGRRQRLARVSREPAFGAAFPRQHRAPAVRPLRIVGLLLLLAAAAGTALLWVSVAQVRQGDIRLSSDVPEVASQSIFSSVQRRRTGAKRPLASPRLAGTSTPAAPAAAPPPRAPAAPAAAPAAATAPVVAATR